MALRDPAAGDRTLPEPLSAEEAPESRAATVQDESRAARSLLRRWLPWAAAAVAVAAVLRTTVLKPARVPVTVVRVAAGRVEESVINSKAGTVKSRRRADLSTEVGGRVLELPARKGAHVRAGDVLLRIAQGDYRAQVAVQRSAVEAAQSSRDEACRTAEQLDRELARNQALSREKLVSPDWLDQLQGRRDAAAAACEAARARIGQARAALDAARVSLEKTVLRAPFDGIVAELTTEVGEWITPSPPGLPIPPVIVLLDSGASYVSAPMDEVDVGKVRTGQPVRITLDAFPGRSLSGRVTRVAPYVQDVQEQNRVFEIEAEFDDAGFAESLLPGISADVEVILASRDGVLRIPSSSILEGDSVLVAGADRLETRKLELGLRNWQFAEVRRGLSPGDAVVVSLDRAEVREGARYDVTAELPP
jgi:HlyD family secretion protein